MLYLIGTLADGAVVSVIPCSDGIDQAIDLAADALSDAEEDAGACADILAGIWHDAVVAEGSPHEGTRSYEERSDDIMRHVVWSRPGWSVRWGIACL